VDYFRVARQPEAIAIFLQADCSGVRQLWRLRRTRAKTPPAPRDTPDSSFVRDQRCEQPTKKNWGGVGRPGIYFAVASGLAVIQEERLADLNEPAH
jgi:hypothetical protein